MDVEIEFEECRASGEGDWDDGVSKGLLGKGFRELTDGMLHLREGRGWDGECR